MLRGIAGALAQASPASWVNHRCLIDETVQICSIALAPLSRSFSSQPAKRRRIAEDGPGLEAFLAQGQVEPAGDASQARSAAATAAAGKVYVETYGCQMNVNDTEVVMSILADAGYCSTSSEGEADLVLLNTCAIRENAEQRVWGRLGHFKRLKQDRRKQKQSPPVVGVLGCMAERLKEKLLDSDRLADIVVGPDAYRDLPRLVDLVRGPSSSDNSASSSSSGGVEGAAGSSRRGSPSGPLPGISSSRATTAMNVQLSVEETYADILPVRPAGATSAFLSIMRGCNNMCAFCIVPFTRGRERSRPASSILEEVRVLAGQGVREVTLLGQNVNSYADSTVVLEAQAAAGPGRSAAAAPAGSEEDPFAVYARGFRSVYRPKRQGALSFAELLARVADVDPEVRVRFTSPHPKDFSDEVLHVIASRPNICKQLHMPAQSGSTVMLERMRRGYSREAYDQLVDHVRGVLPHVALSTDMIVGFCGESEADHAASLALMAQVRYDNAFLFAYSDRGKTYASKHYQDDVPQEVKARRLQEILAVYREGLQQRSAAEVGRTHLVLLEGPARKVAGSWSGKTDTMKKVVVPGAGVPASLADWAAAQAGQGGHSAGGGGGRSGAAGPLVELQSGDYVAVQVEGYSGGMLTARPLARTSIAEFVGRFGATLVA